MQRQLSIFEVLQPLDTAESKVKAGDWVKLRRKTPHAAYWKKGEIVQVESVHPTNGSGRFWNERAECWGYLDAGDMIKTLPPIDVVSPGAIGPVTELEAEPVVTELETEPGPLHSVTDCPIALVTELIPAPAVTELAACSKVREIELASGELYSVTGPVMPYSPRGSAGRGEYFRFSYRAGAKVRHVHIPGGNTGSTLAQQRAAEVMELAAAGVPAVEIVKHIKRWSTRLHRETE